MFWPATSLSMVASSRRAARREYSRLLGDERGGGLDRERVELAGGGAVVEAADGLGGDAHGVDVRQAVAAALHGADDLVDVDRLKRAVALADLHLRGGFGRRESWDRVRRGSSGGIGMPFKATMDESSFGRS